MKKTLYILLFAFLWINVNAQTSGGPDIYGYTWKNNSHTVNPPTYGWFDITTIGTQVTGLADDNIVGPFTASTGFQFYWYPVNQFWIGSNGYISFAGDNIASPFPLSVPLSLGANDWIAPLLADLNFSGTSNPAQCYYYSNADTLCVSFINVPFYENSASQQTGSNTFQIILNKVDKSITFNYLSTNQGNLTTMDNVVGMENNTGNIGLSALIDVLPSSLFCVKFYYPDTVTYAVTDGGVNWNYNEKNAGIFIKTQGAPLTLSTSIKNYGNQPLSSFTVKDTVRNAYGSPVTTGSLTIPSLIMGEDTLVSFTNTFVAPSAGTYSYNTAITGITGDMVASNDRKQMEIIAVNTSNPTISLDYSDGIPDGGGLGWTGGDGGIAVYIEPPVYPVNILSSKFYISANSTPVGFYAMIYDDDGINGTAGTLLDSVYVAPTSITLNVYTVVPTASSNLSIDSGGVYVLWLMAGANINLARDITPPISRRTYEIVGGGWAGYRDMLTEDFLIGINVKANTPEADFYANTSLDPTVQFTDSSTNNPTSWLWNFDYGSATSTLQNPTYIYPINGTFNVCLKVTNPAGSDSICKVISINNVLPVCDFSYDTTAMPTIAFSDLSTGLPTSWLWDFDHAGATSTLKNPLYTYPGNGTYNVCLKVANQAGSDSICKSVVVSNSAPLANFSYDTTNMPTVSFTDLSTGLPNSWLWDFDDMGATSTLKDPDYTFTTNGTHNVCLTSTNSTGPSKPFCQNINIKGVGIGENKTLDLLSIYPNPFSDNTIIQLPGSKHYKDISLKCYNMMGERVKVSYVVNDNKIELRRGNLSKGSYFFELYDKQTKLGNGKFLVQ